MAKATIFGIKEFPLTEFAIAANAILGTRDSGKTYTATKASEELFEAGIPFIWLDPIGVAHNLRVPGKGRGYPVVVAGGQHGDLPLAVGSVGEIVRAAMKSNISLVLDLFSRDLSKADWRRIVRETCEILLHENSEYGLRHVFIEEAAEFVPQRVTDGQVFSAVEKLVRMGGNSKVGVTLINQRSADINKSVLELCANVFVHRQKGKNTLLDLKKWISLTDPETEKKITASLPDLASGQCWVMSNELKRPILIKVPEKNSLHPDRRAAHNPDAPKRKPVPADAFVEQMKAALAPKPKSVAPSQKLGVDVSTPQATVLQLLVNNAAQDGHARSVIEGYGRGHREGFDLGVQTSRRAHLAAVDAVSLEAIAYPGAPEKPVGIKTMGEVRAETRSTGFRKVTPWVKHTPVAGVSGPQQRMLDALAWMASIGVEKLDRPRCAMLSNQSHRSSGFEKSCSTLKTLGLITYPSSGELSLTDAGIAAAVAPESAPTDPDLHAAIRQHVSAPQWKMLVALIDAYPTAMSRDDLAEASNQSPLSSGFEKNCSTLKSLGFACYPERNYLAATPIMFVGGK